MLFEIRNTLIVLKFRLFTLGFISLLWLGCSTEQIKNITGSTPISAYSVIQGFVTGGSVISRSTHSSLSRITLEDGTYVNLNPSNTTVSNSNHFGTEIQTSGPNTKLASGDITDTTVNELNKEINHQLKDSDGLLFGPAVNISLVTDQGVVLQSATFDRYTEEGKLHYRFAGEFPSESMRLRIVEENNIFELAMGSLSESDEVVDVPELDLVNSTLATRMIEQTNQYSLLRSKDIRSFIESMNLIIRTRIDENPSKYLLIENINRVGVNNKGDLEIYPTSYDPFKFRNPDQVKSWERHLFDSNNDISFKTNSLDNERVEDNSSKPPIRKDLVNWIRLVTLDQIGKSRDSVLFQQADFSPQKIYSTYNKKFTLKIYFREHLPIEYRNSILNDGILRIQSGDSQHKLSISQTKVNFQEANLLELKINLSNLDLNVNNKTVLIFLQHTFPDFRVDQIAQAFFKVGLELN